MNSARIKTKLQPSFIVMNEGNPNVDEEELDSIKKYELAKKHLEEMSSFEERSDMMESSSSGNLSRDMDYILEDDDFVCATLRGE